jgi:hypothetical protein
VVDASQGIQAQTLSNLFLAMDAGLEIIPVLNKIDLPGAEPEKRRKQEIVDLIGCKPEDILLVSAKEGIGHPRAARGGRQEDARPPRRRERSRSARSSSIRSTTATAGPSRRSASWTA